ncbi:hypothetical protein NKI50_07385 [Mesorhizobium sp. M0563]
MAPYEIVWLAPTDSQAQAGLDRGVLGADIDAHKTITALQAACGDGMKAGIAESELVACRYEQVVQ